MYEFKTAQELLELCKQYRKPISEIAIRYEMKRSNKRRKEIIAQMIKIYDVMKEAIKKGLKSREKSFLGIAGGDSGKIFKMMRSSKRLLGRLSIRAMAYAVATGENNAKMGRIAAFPTAGGAGVIPGVTFAYSEYHKISQTRHLRGLFTAAAVGKIIAQRATLSAARGGCQAEIGAAAAMAAASVAEMHGGTPAQCFDAAAIALKSYLGLVCDPLGGLVAVPCIKRNALAVNAALSAALIARAGIKSFVPFDEVLDAMNNISSLMSDKLKETARGGLAVTRTGKKVQKMLDAKCPKHCLIMPKNEKI